MAPKAFVVTVGLAFAEPFAIRFDAKFARNEFLPADGPKNLLKI